MKYTVKIENKSYEVEIEDIYARPVIAHVDGQIYEVSPEAGVTTAPQSEPGKFKPLELPRQTAGPTTTSNELTAPLPGTVIEIFVRPDERIESGQVILVIEAMKMKNSIRSTRAGMIAEVLVSAAQTVAHKQALIRFTD